MRSFEYIALDTGGQRITGTIEAESKFDIALQMKGEGNTLLRATEKTKRKFSLPRFLSFMEDSVSQEDKILFARNTAAMLRAGLPLGRALQILERQTRHEGFKNVLAQVEQEIKTGTTLSQAMANHPNAFSKLFSSMVRAGEESGSLAQSLAIVGGQLERTHLLQKKIKGALMYPSIIIVAMLIVGVLMLMYVVPTLTKTFKDLGVDLPPSTQAIVIVSDALAENPLFVLLGSALLVGFIVMFFKTPPGRALADAVIIRLPVIGELVKKVNAARTARTLSSLVSSGVDVGAALSITEDVMQRKDYKRVLALARGSIEKGLPLSGVFKESPIYPILLGEMMAVGEETGKLSDMLLETALFYEAEVEEATKNLSSIIEPILMVFVGTGVGFFAISMIQPMYSLMSNVN